MAVSRDENERNIMANSNENQRSDKNTFKSDGLQKLYEKYFGKKLVNVRLLEYDPRVRARKKKTPIIITQDRPQSKESIARQYQLLTLPRRGHDHVPLLLLHEPLARMPFGTLKTENSAGISEGNPSSTRNIKAISSTIKMVLKTLEAETTPLRNSDNEDETDSDFEDGTAFFTSTPKKDDNVSY